MAKVLGLAVLTALLAAPVQAAPITVSAGDFLTFNFDLSGATPAPPYALASMSTNTSGLDFEPPPCVVLLCELLDIGQWNFWTELNGTGSLFFTHDLSLGGVNHTEMLDGVFSATLQVTEGSITVDPVACGISADGARTPDCPPAEPPVPEPATMALLASGAAAAMLARRRRRRA